MNIEKLRQDTPGCSGLVHLNNAGAALSPQPVVDAVMSHLHLENRLGGYEAESAASEALESLYLSLAKLIGAKPQEIAIAQNATRAWDLLVYAIPLSPGDRILTCRAEYASNYIAFLQRAKHTGAEIVVVDNDEHGALCLESLRSLLDERVKLVAVNHIPTNSGLVQPAAEIGALLSDHPAFYLLDACQSVGQMPIDVREIGCDMLTATSRKFLRGPRGLGFLYLRESLIESLEPPFLDLHAASWTAADSYTIRADARRFETYETFVAGRLGLAAAAEYAMEVGAQWSWERIQTLARRTRDGLREISGVEVHDLGAVQGGIVTFTSRGHEAESLRETLHSHGINVWSSSVLSARLDMEARGLSRVVRVSPHYYNTEDEVDRFLETLKRCLA